MLKKHLLLVASFLLALTSAATPFPALESRQLHPELRTDLKAMKITEAKSCDTMAKTRAEEAEEIFYTLAEAPHDALAFNNQTPGMQIAMAFQLDPAFIAGLSEGEITGISFYTGTQANEDLNKILKATVFVTDNLNGDFLYQQRVDCPPTTFSQVYVPLSVPYNITPGVPLYAGVYFTLTSSDNVPVIVDDAAHVNDMGGWVAIRSNAVSSWRWDNIAEYYGFLTLGATVKANSLTRNSVSVLAVDGQPMAYTNEPFAFQFLLRNNGVNQINTLTLECGIEGEQMLTQDLPLEEPFALNQDIIAGVPDFFATMPTKSSEITVRVKAIDGMPNTAEDASGSYPVTIVPEGKGLDRNVVIEEFTSISCVYCPVGYTSMEKIRADFSDGSIIPVCIHTNMPSRDPLTATSFSSVITNYCTNGVPSAVLNRAYDIYPVYDNLVEMAKQLRMLPGIGAVWGEATVNEETRELTVNTKTKFAFDYTDGDENFILSYVITEDDLGPYVQQNGYSGQDMDVLGGWQDQPSTVELIYNDVARQLDKFSGVKGSVPAEIKSGEEYEYSHSITLLKSIQDLNKINVIVYLLNRRTREIENACMLRSDGNGSFTAGVDELTYGTEDIDAPTEYYNLQGIRVANPSHGLYITRRGNKVSKILIR